MKRKHEYKPRPIIEKARSAARLGSRARSTDPLLLELANELESIDLAVERLQESVYGEHCRVPFDEFLGILVKSINVQSNENAKLRAKLGLDDDTATQSEE